MRHESQNCARIYLHKWPEMKIITKEAKTKRVVFNTFEKNTFLFLHHILIDEIVHATKIVVITVNKAGT